MRSFIIAASAAFHTRRAFLPSNNSADETNRDSAVVVNATGWRRLNVASRRFKKQALKSFRYISMRQVCSHRHRLCSYQIQPIILPIADRFYSIEYDRPLNEKTQDRRLTNHASLPSPIYIISLREYDDYREIYYTSWNCRRRDVSLYLPLFERYYRTSKRLDR